jgi:hypothetical protein
MIKSIIAVVTWPYRYAYDYIDGRPSASQIKTHLTRHNPKVLRQQDGAWMVLELAGTDVNTGEAQSLCFGASTPDDLPVAYAQAEAAAAGYSLCAGRATSLTRSEFSADSKLVRDAKADKALSEALNPVTA